MPYEFYKILHLVAIFGVFLALGASIMGAQLGLDKKTKANKLIGITHGVGLLVILIAGFGLLARTGFSFTSGWVLVKFLVWIALGGLLALIRRKPKAGAVISLIIIGLGLLAASMAVTKPF